MLVGFTMTSRKKMAFYAFLSISSFLTLPNIAASSFPESENNSLSTRQGMFSIRPKSYMNIAAFSKFLVAEPNKCGFLCIRTENCLSYNIEINKKNKKNLRCELLSESSSTDQKNVVPHEDFDHYTLIIQVLI
jgi:hypothetical protein